MDLKVKILKDRENNLMVLFPFLGNGIDLRYIQELLGYKGGL
jgi:hypothetical protein